MVSYEDFIEKIKNKNSGVYFVFGDELFFFDSILDFVKSKYINNVNIFFAEDCNVFDVLNNIYQQSIFNDFNVTIIRNVERSKFFTDKKNEDFIKKYVSTFNSNSILLLFYCKNISKFDSILELFSSAIIYNSKKLVNYQIKNFIRSYCKEKGININDENVDILYDYCGSNLAMIKNELDKENFNNISYTREFNAFEFISYISSKDYRKLCLVVNNFGLKNKDELIPLFGLMFNFFLKRLISLENSRNSIDTYTFLYSRRDVLKIIKDIGYCDNCLKGVGVESVNYIWLLKYIIGSIILKK